MGPLNPHDKDQNEKSNVDHSFFSHRLLKQLSEELDRFHSDPGSFDPQKLEKLAASLFEEISKILKDQVGDSSPEKLIEAFLPNAIRWAKKAISLMQSEEVDDFGLDRKFEMSIKPFFDFLYSKWFRVTVKGIENIPAKGRGLICSNHSGVLPYDAAMMKVAIFNEHPEHRELRFLVDDFVFHFPFLGVLMNRIGGVRACQENAERLLNAEELIAVFPEGIKGIGKPFSERYRLQRFGRGGVIKLAFKTKSPIIPVAVVGAEEIHPLLYKSTMLARPLGLPFIPVTPTFPLFGILGAIPLPSKWTIEFGKPLTFDDVTAKDINDGIRINRENERLRDIIQKMLLENLKERRSVFV